METELAVRSNGHALSVPLAPQPIHLMAISAEDVIARMQHIQVIRQRLMKNGVHFGKPFSSSPKETLLKPGAEMLCTAFGLAPEYFVEDLSTPDEFRYRVTTKLYAIGSNAFVGSGVGEASTNETKYKWRESLSDEEFESVPENRKRLHFKKADRSVFKVKQIRMEAADVANTVLKMAKKRSHTDATLTATGAADMFEQDLEDLKDNGVDIEEGTGELLYYIKSVSSKEIPKNDKSGTFTKYLITTKDGNEFQTLKKAFADLAEQLKASGEPCEIQFKEGKWGKDIENLTKVKEPPKAEPTKTTILTHEQKIAAAVQTFSAHKVTVSQLEKYLDTPKDLWDEECLAKLRRVLEKVNSGERVITDFFE